MRRLVITVLVCLVLAGGALAIQEGDSKAAKKPGSQKSAPVDCGGVNDAAITSSVKDRLSKAPSLKNSDINVETNQGVVTLKGMVKTAGLKGVATRVAKRADCVKKVDNQLSYEQARPPANNKTNN